LKLSIVSLGHVHTEAFEPLTKVLTGIEQVVTNATARAELNRAIDAAANDWILIMRERETVTDALAQEIAESCERSSAWGYRIRTEITYAGKPLRLGDTGELRLLHRRHMLRRGDLLVEGTVIRMRSAFVSHSFASHDEHRDYLRTRGTKRSAIARLAAFMRNARTLDANTLRYVWIESGYVAS